MFYDELNSEQQVSYLMKPIIQVLQHRLGVLGHYNATYLPSIIIVCFRLKNRN